MEDKLQLFLESVEPCNRDFAVELHEYLLQNNCKCEIKTAKSGYIVSYVKSDTKRVLATFVLRKSGTKLRIYPDHLGLYQDFLDSLPDKMKKDIVKASICKRLLDPDACNPRCVRGYTFTMEDKSYQKCRYMAFMPALSDENNPYIKQFLKKELES